MKKRIVLLLVIMIMVICVGCGKNKKSKAAQEVDDKISAIGSVTVDSDTLISEAENAYNSLTDKEKKEVEKYDDLIKAREEYERVVDESYKESIKTAYAKIDELDMKGAYEIAKDLPDDYSTDRDDIIDRVDRMCYENTFICRVENVVSKMPKTTANKPEVNMQGGLTIGNEFSDESSLASAFKEYYDYMNKYYRVKGSQADSDYGQLEWANQKFVFEDEKGHTIEINALSASYIGSFYYFNIVLERNANYRDVIETAEDK